MNVNFLGDNLGSIILTSSAYSSHIGLSNLTITATADGQQEITQTVMISLSMYNQVSQICTMVSQMCIISTVPFYYTSKHWSYSY